MVRSNESQADSLFKAAHSRRETIRVPWYRITSFR